MNVALVTAALHRVHEPATAVRHAIDPLAHVDVIRAARRPLAVEETLGVELARVGHARTTALRGGLHVHLLATHETAIDPLALERRAVGQPEAAAAVGPACVVRVALVRVEREEVGGRGVAHARGPASPHNRQPAQAAAARRRPPCGGGHESHPVRLRVPCRSMTSTTSGGA